MSRTWASRLLRGWPFWLLGLLAVVFTLMLVFSRKAPIIASLDPPMAAPGQTVVVTGDYFGRTEREGSLSLAGEIPPPSLIQSWSDQKIVFVVPEDATSGLVTVSNSQGTSTGVLFTNTESIPTVLQAPAQPSQPLLWAAVPPQPLAGQTVTLYGRRFGTGDEAVAVRIATAGKGPVLEIGPTESLSWSDRTVVLRWPSGADAGTSVTVLTPRGESPPFALGGPSPLVFENPRTLTVEFRAKVTVPAGTAVNLWGPVPERRTGTLWSLAASEPAPVAGARTPLFSWPAGLAGERQAAYKVKLTTWGRRWTGIPAGIVPTGDPPPVDDGPKALWKPATAALRALTARWGLETADPWLRLQRLQAGMAAAFHAAVGSAERPVLTQTPAALLTSGKLTSYEASSLGVALALQGGLAGRLVAGLWLSPNGRLLSRTWAEVWVPGAGWASWDVLDGNLGSLDNRHFAFDVGSVAPQRRLARSTTFGPAPPATLQNSSGEAAGPGPEPVVQWQITRMEK